MVAILCLLPLPADVAMGLGRRPSDFYWFLHGPARWLVQFVSHPDIWLTLLYVNAIAGVSLIGLLIPARPHFLLHFAVVAMLVPLGLSAMPIVLFTLIVLINMAGWIAFAAIISMLVLLVMWLVLLAQRKGR